MSNYSNRPVLVFGGAGFIGRHLVRRLVALGAHVTVYDRHSPEIPGVEFVHGDFTACEGFAEVVRSQQTIFHLVSTTQPSTSNSDPLFDIDSNLHPTIELLRTASTSGAAKVVFASSGGTVYGIPQYVPIKESHPTEPICSYGIVKLAIEKYLQLFKHLHGLDYVALRIANPYGPGQLPGRGQGVIAEFVARAHSGRAFEVFGDGSVVRDFIYIDDAVDALLAAGTEPVTGIFNIGSGIGSSIREIIETIAAFAPHPIEVSYGEARAFDVPSNVLCIDKARSELGWCPHTELRAGIASMFPGGA